MNREIKFRYRYTDGKQWIFQSFTLNQILNGDPYEVISDNPLYKNFKMVGVDEYTGLKDNNGVEIYEGDIVIITGHGIRQPFEVRYFAPSFHILCVPTNVHITMSINSEYEIIGNIYKNTELLNK